ncbi:hypothetical protein [Streptomyces sp. NPDC101145]|uniref:hypothetical protein n=1 Tax=Streptomyces sp. NPDC101145 TaxID=3366112 RepID=UPI0038025357
MGTTLLVLSLPLAILALPLYVAVLALYTRRARDRLRAERRATATARLTADLDQRDAQAAAHHRAATAEHRVLAEAEHIVDTAYANQEGGHP